MGSANGHVREIVRRCMSILKKDNKENDDEDYDGDDDDDDDCNR